MIDQSFSTHFIPSYHYHVFIITSIGIFIAWLLFIVLEVVQNVTILSYAQPSSGNKDHTYIHFITTLHVDTILFPKAFCLKEFSTQNMSGTFFIFELTGI